MTIFNTLLLAIDLDDDSHQLLDRVWRLCKDNMAGVHVLYVLRDSSQFSINGLPRDDDADWRRRQDQAAFRLRDLLYRHHINIDPGRVYIRRGEPANEIKVLAHQLAADLVIVGSHLRDNGWLALPGATTNCVLQGIDSDVMAVRF